MTLASGALLLACSLAWDLSVNFDCAPWRAAQEDALAAQCNAGRDPQNMPLTCPFYPGEHAEAQCIACGTLVSRSGLHEARGRAARCCAAAGPVLTSFVLLRAPRRGRSPSRAWARLCWTGEEQWRRARCAACARKLLPC